MKATTDYLLDAAAREYAAQQRKRRHWHVDERRFLEKLPLIRPQVYHTAIYTNDTGSKGANAAALKIAREIERNHYIAVERRRRGYGKWLLYRWSENEIIAATVVEKRLCHNPACVANENGDQYVSI